MMILIEFLVLCVGLTVFMMQHTFRRRISLVGSKIVYWCTMLFVSLMFNSILYYAYPTNYRLGSYANLSTLFLLIGIICSYIIIQLLSPSRTYKKMMGKIHKNNEKKPLVKALRDSEAVTDEIGIAHLEKIEEPSLVSTSERNTYLKELPFVPDGICIAIPGLVKDDYMVEFSDMSYLTGLTVDYFSEGRFPVRFINDVKAATVCEISNHPNSDTLAVIMAGSGIAIGVYSKGKMITGSHGFAGELGYCVIQTENGPTVLDDVSGGIGILRLAQCNASILLSRLEHNEASAIELIAKAGHYFGLALTNIIHLFNPDTIVIGGSTSTYKGYLQHALSTASQYTLKDMYNACTITAPKDLKRIVALGALEYVRSGLIL